jgi:hypothetical protein
MVNVEKNPSIDLLLVMGPNHFGNNTPYKEDLGQKKFMEKNLLLFVAKGYMPIFVVEN